MIYIKHSRASRDDQKILNPQLHWKLLVILSTEPIPFSCRLSGRGNVKQQAPSRNEDAVRCPEIPVCFLEGVLADIFTCSIRMLPVHCVGSYSLPVPSTVSSRQNGQRSLTCPPFRPCSPHHDASSSSGILTPSPPRSWTLLPVQSLVRNRTRF